MPDPAVHSFTLPDGQEQTIRITGHNMLVRKCRLSEDEFLLGPAQNPVGKLPSYLREQAEAHLKTLTEDTPTNWVEILALGPKCNTSRTPEEMKRLNAGVPRERRVANFYNPAKPGDLCVLPEKSVRNKMFRVFAGTMEDFIVDEVEMEFMVRKEDLDE